MLSIGLIRDDSESNWGGVVLSLFLFAAVAAPLLAAAAGGELATPFAVPLEQLAGVAITAAMGYAGWRMRRSRRSGALRVAIDVLTLAILAAVFAVIIEQASNGFYSQEVLADTMAVLLLLHLVGAALRRVALSRQRWPPLPMLRGDGPPTAPRRIEPAAMQFADALTSWMALLLACFWGLAALGLHEAAGILLILVGAFGALVIVARVPSAFINERVLLREWRVTRRSRRQACLTDRKECPEGI